MLKFFIMEPFRISLSLFLNSYLIPSVLAFVCGGIIGFEREIRDRPAGLRTYTLVCLGSAIFTLTSYLGFQGDIDPTRIAAGVVTGIGFIGAGAIFREGIFVRGLTTAASIWIVAAVGIAIGSRLYYLAFIATIFAFLILTFIRTLEDRLLKISQYTISLKANEEFEEMEELIKYLETFNNRVILEKSVMQRIDRKRKSSLVLNIRLGSSNRKFIQKITEIIKRFRGIDKVELI